MRKRRDDDASAVSGFARGGVGADATFCSGYAARAGDCGGFVLNAPTFCPEAKLGDDDVWHGGRRLRRK